MITADEFLEKYDYDVLNDTLVRVGKIVARLGISKTTFYRWMEDGEFPKPNFFLCGRPVWTMRRFKTYLQGCVDKVS